MGTNGLKFGLICACAWLLSAHPVCGQDWPQWRGPNRDARANSFNAPQNWPTELKQKWKVTVGDGVATPAVVGDRVYVFTREGGNEVIRCLNAENGEQIWQDQYEAESPRGGAARYPGPRSSPAVADGKVVTLGVQGALCCYDAQTGKQLWRKDEFDNEVPMFNVGSSPIIIDSVVVAQLGGEENGGIVAYDLASGEEKWRWEEDSPAYSSPVEMTIGGKNVIVAVTSENLVAVGANDGKTVWELPYRQGGRYNTITPIVAGDTLVVAGPGSGLTGLKITGEGDQSDAERVWRNEENSLQFSTPVLKDGLLFGLTSAGQLFCVNTQSGETAWSVPLVPQQQQPRREEGNVENRRGNSAPVALVQFVQQDEQSQQDRDERRGFQRDRRRGEGRGQFGEGRGRFGGRGGRGGRRGGGSSGYGSVVDAGQVLLALSPAGQLVVFKPNGEEYSEVARYNVAEGGADEQDKGTYAYPVAVGSSIYIKDRESLARWDVN
ncbi:MAG TPA: PQQ-binding-like beta-propeller repeat protein [Lacipirellulaceae bacterium]|jgi:outer membrane protein assembly factor BamB|nr:PQQ-binding-like beta-propeller repeat protein [Lacipirellulaceae bacterium]